MADNWHLIEDVQTKGQGEIEARAFVPVDSTWFSGHFPGTPILPGIALIDMAMQAVNISLSAKGEKIIITALKRVRFTKPALPGDKLSVHIASDEAASEKAYSFKIAGKDDVICSGVFVAATIK